MGEESWLAKSTQGRMARPIMGRLLSSMARIVVVLLRQRNDQLKIGLT